MLKKITIFTVCFIAAAFCLAGCAKPIVSTKEPEQTLVKYLKAWQWADAGTMYSLLSSQDQNIVTQAEYSSDLEELPRPVSYKISGGRLKGNEAQIDVDLEMPSLSDETKIKKAKFFLVKEKTVWRVNEVKTFKDW